MILAHDLFFKSLSFAKHLSLTKTVHHYDPACRPQTVDQRREIGGRDLESQTMIFLPLHLHRVVCKMSV